GYDPKTRVGVVALANASTTIGMDDSGMHLLHPTAPLANPQPVKARKEVTVNPAVLDGYVGRFQLAPNFILAITMEGDRLFAQATGQPKFELFSESEREYFLKVVDAQITFEAVGAGRAPALVLHQMGKDMRAPRVE